MRLSIKEQTFFVKRLSFLIKAGIPVRDSLMMIRDQTKKSGYASMLETVIASVSSGQKLSTSLDKFKNMFSDFTINIIGFGEQSGILSENLEYVADELHKRQALRKKIISASVYPLIVTIATIGITAFLIIYLFPKIMPIFRSINLSLPLSTRIVLAVSNFSIRFGLIGLVLIIAASISFSLALKKSYKVRLYFDSLLLKLPVVGKIIIDYNLANFARTLGLLLKSGITIGEALQILANTTSNQVYKKEFTELFHAVNRGSKISAYLGKKKQLFPDMATHIVAAGEHSGNLPDSLMYLSDMYETEIDDFTKNLGSIVEPVLMIIMGLLVGFIAISIITPIYGITQHLAPR